MHAIRARTVSSSTASSQAFDFDDSNPHNVVRGAKHGRTNGGPAIYLDFETRIQKLDRSLRNLCIGASKLRSSAGILSASTRLRRHLGPILRFFHNNALQLYSELPKQPRDLQLIHRSDTDKGEVVEGTSRGFIEEFHEFLSDVGNLLDCFRQFPQFSDELSDRSFLEELQVWAASVNDFEFNLNSYAVQKSMYDSMVGVGVHIETLAEDIIPTFTAFGLPAVRASQDRGSSNLEGQTLIATLFASIAASMLQIWEPAKNTVNDNLTNTVLVLWYMALVFSVSSAVNGLLGLSWVHALYRTPDHRVRWWVLMWINKFPLVSLCLSMVCFFIGLILFVFASLQTHATAIVTTVLSSICFGLVLMSAWLTYELLLHTRKEDQIKLTCTITNLKTSVLSGILMKETPASKTSILKTQVPSGRLMLRMANHNLKATSKDSRHVSFWLAFDKDYFSPRERARHRWLEALRRILDDRREQLSMLATRPTDTFLLRRPTMSMRFRSISKLMRMKESEDYHVDERHEALISDMQFAQHAYGDRLVTAGWDTEAFLLRIQAPVLCERVLQPSVGCGLLHQVEWSPDCSSVLLRSKHQITVWKIPHHGPSSASVISGSAHDAPPVFHRVHWHQGSETSFPRILVVQDGKLSAMDVTGKILEQYPMELVVRDVCVTSCSRWMVCVGHTSFRGARRQKAALVVWDLENRITYWPRGQYKCVFHKMSDIKIAHDDVSVLINHEDKSPPQLWHLQINSMGQMPDLLYKHTYIPQENTSFTGLPSIFGGEMDHLVLRATTDGYIYVWDRDSAILVHKIELPFARNGELVSFTWNRGSSADMYMIAAGTHDGTIHILTTFPEEKCTDEDKHSIDDVF